MAGREKVTIYDIAEAAGVSVATVNRALYNKPRISEETRKRILQIAAEMNFKVNSAARSLRRNTIRFYVVLCCPIPGFLGDVERGVRYALEELSEYKVEGTVETLDTSTREHWEAFIIERLQKCAKSGYDAVVLFSSTTSGPLREVIDDLFAAGVPVATVVTDVEDSNRVLTVGCNGICAGQLAAEVLRMTVGSRKVAILTGDQKVSIHMQNLKGFMQFAQRHPFQEVLLYEHFDEPQKVIASVDKLLGEHPDVAGIYCTSASSVMACERMKALGYGGKVKIITTDLFPETKELLREETVCATIYQDPFRQGRNTIFFLYDYLCKVPVKTVNLILPHLALNANMDYFHDGTENGREE